MKEILLLACLVSALCSMRTNPDSSDAKKITSTSIEENLRYRDEGFYMTREGEYSYPRETLAFMPDSTVISSMTRLNGRYEIVSDTLYLYFPKEHYPFFKPVWVEPDGYQYKLVAYGKNFFKLVWSNYELNKKIEEGCYLEFTECRTPFKI